MTRDPADELADAITRRGLGEPARILLDAHRPIAPLLADGATFLRPLLSALGPGARRAQELLAEPDGLDRLRARLNSEIEQDRTQA